jgi:hypothetical protein
MGRRASGAAHAREIEMGLEGSRAVRKGIAKHDHVSNLMDGVL